MQRACSLLSAFWLLLLSGCGDNPNDPTQQIVAGSYTATALSVTRSNTTVEMLEAGAFIEITLTTQGQTTGRLVTPAEFSESGQTEEDNLSGTWTLNGDKVRFSHAADTYLRDTEFRVDGNILVGELRNSGISIRTVLTRH